MPYITCNDGNTYSRYDSKPYVKQCIKEQREEFNNQNTSNMNDPILIIVMCVFITGFVLGIATLSFIQSKAINSSE